MYQLKEIPSEAAIRKFLRRILFGRNIFCPECRSRDTLVYETRYRCRVCRCKFSLLSHTWLSHLRLPLQEFWLILWYWTTQIPIRQTEALTGLSGKGVRHWYDIFRSHLPKDKTVLEAIIQLDEAYFGGWKGRTLLMGKQAGTRKIAYTILPHTNPARIDAYQFVKEYINSNSKIYTDGNPIYKELDLPITHESEIHKQFEYTKTSETEGLFGVLRTFIRRMYHHVTVEKFPDYMSEFYFRFSHPEMFKSPRYFLTKTLYLVPIG